MSNHSQPPFAPRFDVEQPQQFNSGNALLESYRRGLLAGMIVYVAVGRDEEEYDEPLITHKATVVSPPELGFVEPVLKVWDTVEHDPCRYGGATWEASPLEVFTVSEVRDVLQNDHNSIANVPVDDLVQCERYNAPLAVALRAAAAQRMLEIRLTDAAILESLKYPVEED